MTNKEIAAIFYIMADILEIKEVQWKPQAYRKAARAIESLSEDVKDIYKEGGLKELDKIPGVGSRLAKKIEEFIKTGRVKEHKRLLKTVPKGVDKLMEVHGLGPKKVKLLLKKKNIKSIKDLEQALKKHKLKGMKGFAEKTEENLQRGIELYRVRKKRMLVGEAYPIAADIVGQLKKLKQVHKAVAAGSLRRMQETIGDVDILITSSNPKKVMDFFTVMKNVKRVLVKGTTKSAVLLDSNLQVDVRVLEDKCFGAALQYFTGSKAHNIALRKIAMKKGLKLSEYGVFIKKTNKLVAGKTEQEVYKKLGMRIIPPELRNNAGEIEAAIKNKLPKLVELKDIKGDLHIHSNFSDGSNSIRDIAKHCKGIGYKYAAITDHFGSSLKIANAMDEKRLLKCINEAKKTNSKLSGFNILAGAEVNIRPDGSIDISEKMLKKLDIVIAAVHSSFKQAKKDMTKRMIKAVENKYVHIIGHPTGRLINYRDSYEFDTDKVFQSAKDNGKIIEINAFPTRLDLKDTMIQKAREFKIKFSIATDAHNIDHLRFMLFGVATARRGWCSKKDIVNCLSCKQLKKLL